MQKNKSLNKCVVIFSFIFLLGILPVSHAKLYKWIDDSGIIQYTQLEPTDGSETEDVKLPASVNIDTSEAIKFFEQQQQQQQEFLKDREKKNKKRMKQEKFLELKKENCEKAKAKYENINNAARIRSVDAEGNVTRATEEERQRRIKDAQEKIEKWCN